jgi:UDP-glucose 4-epimerase
MHEFDCRNFVFSSTCATYGNPQYLPIDEKHPQEPINPYGASKLMLERIVQDYHNAYGLNYMFLRYFNACGASSDGKIGEDHEPETHLIPLAIRAAQNPGQPLAIFGGDYATPDGTCIRDYIHVEDLADAHVAALDYLLNGGESTACNLGAGAGSSVKEIVDMVEKVTGYKVPVKMAERRAGDPAQLVAVPSKAKDLLKWEARYSLEYIIETAWRWFDAPHKGSYKRYKS